MGRVAACEILLCSGGRRLSEIGQKVIVPHVESVIHNIPADLRWMVGV